MFAYKYQHSDNKQSWIHVAKIMRGEDWENKMLRPHEQGNHVAIDIATAQMRFDNKFKDIYDGREDLELVGVKMFIAKLYNDLVHTDVALDKTSATSFLPTNDFVLREVYKLISGSAGDDEIKSIQNKMIAFLGDQNERRKYHFHGRERLVTTCSAYRIKIQTSNQEKTIINKIAEFEKDESTSNELPAITFDDIKMQSTERLLGQSFQTKFVGSKKAACETGHRNESKVANNFANDVAAGLLKGVVDFILLGMYTTGLVAKKGMPYVKDSIDVILHVEMADGEQDMWGCEIKSRVSASEAAKETTFQRHRHGAQGCGTRKYTMLHQNFLHHDIQKLTERCQLLHHAYVYNIKTMVYLVGETNGKILHGNIISFQQDFLDSYGLVLKDMYPTSLSCFYDADERPFLLERVAKLAAKNKK